ncbi:MAG: lycopene cyclase family protein [Chthoniobacterales bacterium]
MKPAYDIAFAGAGLAGLSLAVRLAALPRPPRMLLIDPRESESRDRTWCYWHRREGPFDSAITHSWKQWIVRSPDAPPAGTSGRDARHPYVRIPADRFRQLALEKLEACPQAEFLRGVSVTSLEDAKDHAVLQLSTGRRVASSWTFDSRPPRLDNAPWRQIFRGLELHAPRVSLETGTVTLMDFQSAGPDGIRFFYVLPLDPQTALVEDTWLVPWGKTPCFSDDEILSYATRNLGPSNWQIGHREEGNLPMGLLPSSSSAVSAGRKPNRIIPWGTAAGAVRTSSGYAFSRVQRASDRMAAAWARNGRPDRGAGHGSRLLEWMDRVFLRAISDHPERVPEYFVRLFERVQPEALVRFLESDPQPGDILRVMRALPATPFLRAALQ